MSGKEDTMRTYKLIIIVTMIFMTTLACELTDVSSDKPSAATETPAVDYKATENTLQTMAAEQANVQATAQAQMTALAADVNATTTAAALLAQATPTATATTIPSPTLPPSPTVIFSTDTPSLSEVTVKNNLGRTLKISLNGPAQKTFSVNAHSSFSFETPPGVYSYQAEAQGFFPETGTVEFTAGPFTWTWGKEQ
jgi:hypothetical protein